VTRFAPSARPGRRQGGDLRLGVGSMAATSGSDLAAARTRASWAATSSAEGWAKMVRTMVATKGWALFGTRASRLRMKCVRQRCHDAPGSAVSRAASRPLWSSEITSCTPPRPRFTSSRKNIVQAAPSRW
jgi:hypothetical protein